jgi:hypothetical protein
MTRETADLLVENGRDIELYDGYSGRGMYGERTCGVVYGSTGDLLAAVAAAAKMLTLGDEGEARADGFIEEVRRLRFDDMARRQIAY